MSVAVDLLEMLWYTKNALEATGLTLLDVAVAIKKAERDICDYCQRGSVLASALADSKADALKGHRGPSHVERLLHKMQFRQQCLTFEIHAHQQRWPIQ